MEIRFDNTPLPFSQSRKSRASFYRDLLSKGISSGVPPPRDISHRLQISQDILNIVKWEPSVPSVPGSRDEPIPAVGGIPHSEGAAFSFLCACRCRKICVKLLEILEKRALRTRVRGKSRKGKCKTRTGAERNLYPLTLIFFIGFGSGIPPPIPYRRRLRIDRRSHPSLSPSR